MSKNPHSDQEVPTPDDAGRETAQPGIPYWDPRSDAVQKDQIAAYDQMRRSCPLAQSQYGYTSVFRHADVLRVVQDHDTFSNAVSRFPSVPNGMDPARTHAAAPPDR